MNDTKRKEIQEHIDKINKVPYVLFINDKGQGFTLNRNYKLLHSSIGETDGMPRSAIAGMLPLASKSVLGYPLTDPEAVPSWVNKRIIARENNHNFTAYWFDQSSDEVQEAFFNPKHDVGVTKHFTSVRDLNEEIKDRKAAQRADITAQYRQDFRIRKPFFSDGTLRFYLHSDDPKHEAICAEWNDRYWTAERFTNKGLNQVIDDIKCHLTDSESVGVFSISLEGQYCAAENFDMAELGYYTPWGEYFEINDIATIVTV